MSDSESGTSGEFAAEKGVKRLRDVLFQRKPRSRSRVHSIAVEAQQLTDNARAFVAQAADGLSVEVPKRLRETALPSADPQELDTRDHQKFLRDQTCFVIQERQREIEETQRRLEQALHELDITKQEEEEILQQKVVECQQDYLDSMSRLQEQFITQADELKMATMTQLAQYRSQCETTVETRAKALCATLATESRTMPSSPRTPRSSPLLPTTMRPSQLHSKLEGLHKKVTADESLIGSSAKKGKKRSGATKTVPKGAVDDETHLRRSSARSMDVRKGGKEASFKFSNAADAGVELRRNHSNERRSFLELLDSDED